MRGGRDPVSRLRDEPGICTSTADRRWPECDGSIVGKKRPLWPRAIRGLEADYRSPRLALELALARDPQLRKSDQNGRPRAGGGDKTRDANCAGVSKPLIDLSNGPPLRTFNTPDALDARVRWRCGLVGLFAHEAVAEAAWNAGAGEVRPIVVDLD